MTADNRDVWAMLAATIRSHEPWLLRARCLEALGIAAATADEATAKLILATLLASTEDCGSDALPAGLADCASGPGGVG